MNNSPINLEKSVWEWNSNPENAALIIPLSQITFRITYFSGDNYFKIAIDGSTIKAIENRLNLKTLDNVHLVVPYSITEIFGEYWENKEVWLWIDRKKLKEIFTNRDSSSLKLTREQIKIYNKEYLTNFFDFFHQKVLVTVKELEEKLKNKVFDSQAVFWKDNFNFYDESFNTSNCQCEHPAFMYNLTDPVSQVLFHVRNCFKNIEELEQFKKIFLQDCANANLKESPSNNVNNHNSNSNSEHTANSQPFSPENQSQSTNNSPSVNNTSIQETQNNQQTENEETKQQRGQIIATVIKQLKEKQNQGKSLTNEEQDRLNKAKKDLSELEKGNSEKNSNSNFPTDLAIGIGVIIFLVLGSLVLYKVKRKLTQNQRKKQKSTN